VIAGKAYGKNSSRPPVKVLRQTQRVCLSPSARESMTLNSDVSRSKEAWVEWINGRQLHG